MTEKIYVDELKDVEGHSGFPNPYRKLPVIIRSVKLKKRVQIKTREGVLVGEIGDFLIEGVQKEVYLCGRKIFFKTYEAVLE